jgi:hypothetical protein
MGTYVLSEAERKLFDAVQHGDPAIFDKPDEDKDIRAVVLRHFVLGLPVVEGEEGPIRATASLFGARAREKTCFVTGVGIRIEGADITGPFVLDSATGKAGAALCPLEFTRCRFLEGFSGRQAKFSQLSLSGCTFGDPPRRGGEDLPTIDVSGAEIGGDLDMDEIHAESGACLWIRAFGVRIDGDLNLCGADLKPPKASDADALYLSLAEIHGDVQARNGFRARGRIRARGAQIQGDVWMPGADLDGAGQQALLFQSATIGGILLLDGRDGDRNHRDEPGIEPVFREFLCAGEINLRHLRLGGHLSIVNANLTASVARSPTCGPRDSVEAAPTAMDSERICLRLGKAVIGGMSIGEERSCRETRLLGRLKLDDLEVSGALTIENALLGAEAEEPDGAATIDGRWLVAKRLAIDHVRPLLSLPGDHGPSELPPVLLSADFSGAAVGGLEVRDSHFIGDFKACPLKCSGSVVLDARVDGSVDLTGATVSGSLDLSRLRLPPQGRLSLTDGTIGRVLRLAWNDAGAPRSAERDSSLPSDFTVEGDVDLRGLTCDTLDDQAGLLWRRPARIRMNHFVYRQATWEERDAAQHESSHRRMMEWLRTAAADRIWLWVTRLFWCWFGLTRDMYETTVRWAPWQVRRNWIYRQFILEPDLIHPARHQIHEHEYRPQPFEQAIRVARAEGREDSATLFEMLKFKIEWRLFNRRIRWRLAAVAIAAAAGWLILKGGTPLYTGAALVGTWILMALVSTTHKLSGESRFWTAVVFYLPALALLVFDGWWRRPFHFLVALSIYLVIRYLSVLAHAAMRGGFGYLRRPVRAIVTLLIASLLGWWAVHHANKRNMLVIDAAPVAGLAGPEPLAHYPLGYDASGTPVLMGSEKARGEQGFARELSCAATISEALYALDVLIPIIDLGEEGRCEVRRDPDPQHRRVPIDAAEMDFWQVLGSIPALPLDDHRFWWWMKALYAIAGWFIVSLAILTFAQANRTHAEPPTEHK